MPLSQARAELPSLLTRVEHGEEVTITRHGRAVAVLVHPDALRVRRAESALAAADRLRHLLDAARDEPMGVGLSAAQAEGLVAEVRTDRDTG